MLRVYEWERNCFGEYLFNGRIVARWLTQGREKQHGGREWMGQAFMKSEGMHRCVLTKVCLMFTNAVCTVVGE